MTSTPLFLKGPTHDARDWSKAQATCRLRSSAGPAPIMSEPYPSYHRIRAPGQTQWELCPSIVIP